MVAEAEVVVQAVAEPLPMPLESVEVEVELPLLRLLVRVVLVAVPVSVVSGSATANQPPKVELRADRSEQPLAFVAQPCEGLEVRADRDGLATPSQPRFLPHMDALLERPEVAPAVQHCYLLFVKAEPLPPESAHW